MDFPVFSCGVTPMTGKYRMECAEVNGPVSLCGCLVMPGDLIVADGSGVCIVPNELVEEVLEKAEKSAAKEEAGICNCPESACHPAPSLKVPQSVLSGFRVRFPLPEMSRTGQSLPA